MERIDSINHDPNGNGEGKRGFHGGNYSIGVKATYWTPKWANYVQEEIANVIEGFGVPLDGTKKNQMFEVLRDKFDSLKNHPIPQNTNLNTIITDGIRNISTDAVATTCANIPAPLAGVLEVFTASAAIVVQKYHTYTGRSFTRSGYNANGDGDFSSVEWGSGWREVATSVQASMPANANLNYYTTDGDYHQSLNVDAGTGANYPVPTAGRLVVSTDFNGQRTGIVMQQYQTYTGRSFTRSGYDPATPSNFDASNKWTDWREVLTAVRSSMPAGANLNYYTTDGDYHQSLDADALTGFNYPIPVAGRMTVSSDFDGHRTGFVLQQYQTYTGRFFTRSGYDSATPSNFDDASKWTAWRETARTGTTLLDYNIGDAVSVNRTSMPADANLDEYIRSGLFNQSVDVGAASGFNYPVLQAGTLAIEGDESGRIVNQEYAAWGGRRFGRSGYDANGDHYIGAVEWGKSWREYGMHQLQNMPNNADFNGYIRYGIYHQSLDSWAATGFNYPVPLAGTLTVTCDDDGRRTGIVNQQYITYTGRIFNRSGYDSNTPSDFGAANKWTPWREVATKGSVTASSQMSVAALTPSQAVNNALNFTPSVSGKLTVFASLNFPDRYASTTGGMSMTVTIGGVTKTVDTGLLSMSQSFTHACVAGTAIALQQAIKNVSTASTSPLTSAYMSYVFIAD